MSDKRHSAKTAVICALLAVLGAVLGILEGMLPLNLVLPIPGVKLGLANLFVMCAFLMYGAPGAFAVSAARILLVFMFSGNVTAFLLSSAGGAAAFIGLWGMMRFYGRRCTMIGISAVSSALHGVGQTAAALCLIGTPVLYYLPVLCGCCALTGVFTGALTNRIARRLPDLTSRLAQNNH